MFLKSLEVRGFKSFADKTELQFQKGITAVVGPNGSGKSNISDAVRWVLGEQSVKSLRGAKMEDIIFAGTQFRKPVGLAQVALTLNNDDNELNIDYSDVRVTRRLYRSGESEYLINNTKCRLKDIQELFMDTGIGKEGYSIIGQGKIDAILNGRPEDRRKLLEEAAGIVKFKTRKEEAEKRLESTEQNLIRIDDILGTYEERIEPLREEMERAKEFIELSKDLKDKEINLVVDSIDKLDIKIKNLQEQINGINNEIKKLENTKAQYNKELQHWNDELEKFDQKTSQDKQSYYDNKSFEQDVVNDIKVIEEKKNNLLLNIEKNNKEKEELYRKINILKDNLLREEDKLKSLKESYEKMKIAIENQKREIEVLNVSMSDENKDLENLKNEEINISTKANHKNNSLVLLNRENDNLQVKINEAEVQYENFHNIIKINSSTKLVVENERENILNIIYNFEEKIKNNNKELGSLRTSLVSSEKSIKELSSKLNKAEANHNVLVNLDQQYEGYTKAVKNLMLHIEKEQVRVQKNSCSVLGEVIKVNKKLETAIEIALGSAISNIITKDEATATLLIRYLKDKHLGRATFLPLNIIQGRILQIYDNIRNLKGYIGVASQLIEYDEKFKKALDYVLGKVVIVDNMDNALIIAKSANHSFKIVTLDGQVLNPGGSLTGGSIYQKSTSIIGRKREIDELEKNAKSLKEDILKLNSKIDVTTGDIRTIDEENLNLRDEIHSHKIELTKLEGKINGINVETEKVKVNLSECKTELEMAKERILRNRETIKEVEKDVEQLNIYKESIEKEIQNLQIGLKNRLEKIGESKDKLTELKIKDAQNNEMIINQGGNIERIKKEIEELYNKGFILQQEIKSSQNKVDECSKNIESNRKKSVEIHSILEELEKVFEENEIERVKIKESIKSNKENLESVLMELSNMEKELHRHQLSFTRYEGDNETLYTKLNEEYELTYAEALDYKFKIEDINKFKIDIAEIKKRISVMGLVNVGAIEEYKEVKEKYTFMKNQREDLMNSKNEIINVINEMTEKMRDVFRENFEILRMNFDETFRELFKGGSADLILI